MLPLSVRSRLPEGLLRAQLPVVRSVRAEATPPIIDLGVASAEEGARLDPGELGGCTQGYSSVDRRLAAGRQGWREWGGGGEDGSARLGTFEVPLFPSSLLPSVE